MSERQMVMIERKVESGREKGREVRVNSVQIVSKLIWEWEDKNYWLTHVLTRVEDMP